MGALSFDALLRSLKQGVPDPVYYLHGDEDVLKDEAIRALLERAVDPAARDFNVDQRSAVDLDPESFHTLVNTPPMLAAARMVVIRGLEQLRKAAKVRQELARYLDSPNPTTVLVLVQGAGEPPDAELARRATTVAVEPLPPARVERWLAHRASQLGLVLAPDATELLLAAVGNDLAALAGELEKLAAATGGAGGAGGAGGRTATRDAVAALVGVRRGETVQDLVDAALERRAAAAAVLVDPVLEQAGMSGVRIVTALATALVGTALARAERDRGAPQGPLGRLVEPPRAVRRAAPRARRRPRPQVEHGHGRAGDSRAARTLVRGVAAGGGMKAVRRLGGWTVSVVPLLLTAYPANRLIAQTDTLRATALRVAQTRPDSARAMMRRLVASLSPQDSLYPGALFTAGRIAADATAAATNLQRVVVEYGRSVWADSALVLLTQLYF